MKHRLFLDGDDNCWFLRSPSPLWTDAEMVEIEAKRLAMSPKLGDIAIILRSDKGWHLRFNRSQLTWPEMEAGLCASKMEHHGHRHFSLLLEDDTLRVSKKPSKTSQPPRIWKVIKFE